MLTLSWSQAVKRIVQRDGVKEEDAWRRLKSQWPNAKLIGHANVVLCTLWEPDVTQRQVHTPDPETLDGWCALFISKHVDARVSSGVESLDSITAADSEETRRNQIFKLRQTSIWIQHFQNSVTVFLSWSVQKHATVLNHLTLVTFINKRATISSYLALLMCWMRFGTENTEHFQ